MTMMLLLLFFCCVSGSFAQRIGFGACPKRNTVSNLNASALIGMWYENRRSIPNLGEFLSKCATFNISANDDVSLKAVFHELSELTGLDYTSVVTIRRDDTECGDDTGCGKLLVGAPIPLLGKIEVPAQIIDTDYNSYLLISSCIGSVLNYFEYIWLLAREPVPSDSLTKELNDVLANNELGDATMSMTEQQYCP